MNDKFEGNSLVRNLVIVADFIILNCVLVG